MSKVLVFAGSNSSKSINKQLATYAASLLTLNEYHVVDLNDFGLPIFGVDEEAKNGYPENALKFDQLIKESKGIILSLAEHNGSYAAVFKNLFDWLSRISKESLHHKPMLLMSTSPGARGGASVHAAASDRFPRHSAKITASFKLPSFNDNFSTGQINNPSLKADLQIAVKQFEASL